MSTINYSDITLLIIFTHNCYFHNKLLQHPIICNRILKLYLFYPQAHNQDQITQRPYAKYIQIPLSTDYELNTKYLLVT